MKDARRSPILDLTRQLLGPAPRKISASQRDELAQKKPPWLEPKDPLSAVFSGLGALLEGGHLTWGCVVIANEVLWEPGDQAAPGLLVHGTDPTFDPSPCSIQDAAVRVARLRSRPSCGPSWEAVARAARDDLSREMKIPLPPGLNADAPAALSTFFLFPRHLPDRHLRCSLLPVLVHPEMDASLILPEPFWGEDLKEFWREWSV